MIRKQNLYEVSCVFVTEYVAGEVKDERVSPPAWCSPLRARYCSASTLANWIGIEFSRRRRPYRCEMKSHAHRSNKSNFFCQGATQAWEVTYWSSCAPAARNCRAHAKLHKSVNRWVRRMVSDELGAVNAANRAINMQIAAAPLLASSFYAISSASWFA